jgi:hypothetical protein
MYWSLRLMPHQIDEIEKSLGPPDEFDVDVEFDVPFPAKFDFKRTPPSPPAARAVTRELSFDSPPRAPAHFESDDESP